MDKKVKIGIGIGTGVVVVGTIVAIGIVNGWFYKDNNVDVRVEDTVPVKSKEIEIDASETYVGKPLPNIINKAGTIKKTKKNSVVINGPDDEDILIRINSDTEIYGADGRERDKSELDVGMYITADIDGDTVNSETEFVAKIIYISGK